MKEKKVLVEQIKFLRMHQNKHVLKNIFDQQKTLNIHICTNHKWQ